MNTYDFHTFCYPNNPDLSSETFSERIEELLYYNCDLQSEEVRGMTVRSAVLSHKDIHRKVPVYFIQEDVDTLECQECKDCSFAGWSHHFVSRRVYHIVIPADKEWKKPIAENVLDSKNNLLHGVIHCNGFGHLLRITGIQGGSKKLRGRELMDLWDRICTHLRTRGISLVDRSEIQGMSLVLLYGLAFGNTWFQKLGFTFSRSAFGITEEKYENSIAHLGQVRIDDILRDLSPNELSRKFAIIVRYNRIRSIENLRTVNQLFKYLLLTKSQSRFGAQQLDPFSDIIVVYRLISEELTILLGDVNDILKNKMFVKELSPEKVRDGQLSVFCEVHSDWKLGPGIRVVVPIGSTIGELKEAAGEALGDCYCCTEKFQVTEIVGLDIEDDTRSVSDFFQSDTKILVRGSGQDKLKHQGGAENWVVKCKCGANDDDGEDMVSCDVCKIWEHTICAGVDDDPEIRSKEYKCLTCIAEDGGEVGHGR